MKAKVVLVESDRLRAHERIDKRCFEQLFRQIQHDGFIDDPIIVDEQTMVILDGHHRYTVGKRLGLRLLPVYFVDYRHKNIKVLAWRRGERVTKTMVVQAGLSGKLLEPKTSRHLICDKPRGLKISLDILR